MQRTAGSASMRKNFSQLFWRSEGGKRGRKKYKYKVGFEMNE